MHRVSKFSWLVFLEEPLNEEFYEGLLVPYNCEFIIVYSIDKIKFELVEIYNLKNLTFSSNFGIWEPSSGVLITNVSLFRRRINFNNTGLIINSHTPKNVRLIIIQKIFCI